MADNKRVSIVMCTYNGERFIRQQIESVIKQTYPLHEILIQDDGSTDGTWAIIEQYAKKYQAIRPLKNNGVHGVNSNFFSAMRKATGDFIAICDQDDIWGPNKIEKQISAIGDNLLCTGRSKPFSDDNSQIGFDPRFPNYHLVRLLFSTILGHTMLFRRELLDMVPNGDDNYYNTVYDDILGLTAAAHDSIAVCNEVLVHQRRYSQATTISQFDHDPRRTPSIGNGLFILKWSLIHYHAVRKQMASAMKPRLQLIADLKAEHSVDWHDALRIMEQECTTGIGSYMKLTRLFLKHRHHLFFAIGRGGGNFLRALLFPLMQVYNYRQLIDSE